MFPFEWLTNYLGFLFNKWKKETVFVPKELNIVVIIAFEYKFIGIYRIYIVILKKNIHYFATYKNNESLYKNLNQY
jgi:hypothetical protein